MSDDDINREMYAKDLKYVLFWSMPISNRFLSLINNENDQLMNILHPSTHIEVFAFTD